MTIDQFATATAERIPTPAEFVAFAREQGWTIAVNGAEASLRVPDKTDPLAVAFARMLSREPYRTNVLAVLQEPPPVIEYVLDSTDPSAIGGKYVNGKWFPPENR